MAVCFAARPEHAGWGQCTTGMWVSGWFGGWAGCSAGPTAAADAQPTGPTPGASPIHLPVPLTLPATLPASPPSADNKQSVDLPPPAIVKPVELWSGKQLFSLLIRPK